MSERVSVTLKILAVHKEASEKIIDQTADEGPIYLDEFVSYVFYEVNYGNLDFLHLLEKEGIAYDSTYDAGNDWPESTESLRFDEFGYANIKLITEYAINPPIGKLIEFLDDHAKLKEFILTHQQEYTPIPWNNQEAWGKLRLLREVIGA